MYNRFRDLEQAPEGKRIDTVLMAAVTGFEELARPTRHDLKQFAELFAPLFAEASPPAKRTAVAALSRCPKMPAEIVEMIGREDMDVAAPFLANSPALTDDQIARILAASNPARARALARRKALSPRIVAALAETGDAAVLRSLKVRRLLPAFSEQAMKPSSPLDDRPRIDSSEIHPDAETADGDEQLREQLRSLVGSHLRRTPAPAAQPLLRPVSPAVAGRLRRFAETQEAIYFATALADALDSSFQLAERIMLDISGTQLAETLTALDLDPRTARIALEAFFPHLKRISRQGPLSELVLHQCDPQHARARITLWLRADRSSEAAEHLPQVSDARQSSRGGNQHETTTDAARNGFKRGRG